MSDLPAEMTSQTPLETLPPHFEQRLFDLSPFGTLPTAIAVFIVLLGSFEATARLTDYSLREQLTLDLHAGAWPATILSLLVAVGLALQRYVRIKDLEEAPAFAHILPCTAAESFAGDARVLGELRWFSLAGIAVGFAGAFLAVPADVRTQHLPIFAWFAIVMSLVGAMFARGVVLSRVGARSFSARVDRYLKVDLMRVDELFVIGRRSARSSLIWLSAAAIVCLFFAGGRTPAFLIAIVAASAGMAFWIFFGSLEHVHRKIRDAKVAELDHVRRDIATARLQASHDHTAAAKLHGLIAYEARIADVKEWPFDQWTLLRVSAYVLIPAIPTVAQTGFKYFVEHFWK
ncbi:MAG TPA: hypothetical protein VKB71_08775 [Rhizomicrobium sp.]|nr:hypothetical protein [Rhizomicrobium sp.]